MTRKIYTSLLSILSSIFLFFFLSNTSSAATDIAGSWFTVSNLPYNLANHVSVGLSSKLHILGGSNTDDFSSILQSTQNSDGSISEWTLIDSLLEGRYFSSSASNSENLYLLGGATFDGFQSNVNTVYVTTINSDGTLGNWQETSPLPNNLSLGSSVVVDDWIFYAGGFNNSGKQDEVYSAKINPDGTLEPWSSTPAGTLPEPMDGFGMISYGDKIIIFGGRGVGDTRINSVYEATVDIEDGSLSTWTLVNNLPVGIARFGYTLVEDTVIIAGGETPAKTDKVHFAKFDSNEELGEWQESENTLPSPVGGGPTLNYLNGFLYLIGGYENDYSNKVYSAEFNDGVSTGLDVPFYNQNDNPWGNQEYDHAESLGFSDPDFERWGCAVTSAAMVLNYHNINEFKDNSDINPGSLNQWLKENGGYLTGSGAWGSYSYLLWPSISTLTQQLVGAGKSDMVLEHKRVDLENRPNILKDDIETNKIPAILRVQNDSTSSHFVVAKGFDDSTYLINDPEWNYPDLTSFGNTYSQINRYVPSNTDSSYIVAVVNPGVEILVTDNQDNKEGKIAGENEFSEIDNASYGFQESINNPDNERIPQSLGTGVNEFLLPKPSSGEYQITLSSEKDTFYSLNVSTFQEDGTQTHKKITGIIQGEKNDKIIINFSKSSESSIEEYVTFESLMNDLLFFYEEGEMKNFGTYKSLDSQLKNAKRFYDANKVKLVFLNNFERKVKQYEKKGHLSSRAKDYLLKRTEILRERL